MWVIPFCLLGHKLSFNGVFLLKSSLFPWKYRFFSLFFCESKLPFHDFLGFSLIFKMKEGDLKLRAFAFVRKTP